MRPHCFASAWLSLSRTELLVILASASALVAGACFTQSDTSGALRFRTDVQLVRDVASARPRALIPPFQDCRAPKAGDTTTNPSGKVCTNVGLPGATEEGKSFAEYASCDVVRTQRPYYPKAPAGTSTPNDPRLNDAAFMGELAWAKSQIEATGCVCCHDSRHAPMGASQWDIGAGPIWLDSMSDTGLALFVGDADSSVLGAYEPSVNNGFDRTATGIPTTDTARMKAFLRAELARRGVSEGTSRGVPPFGGPIYENSVRAPTQCVAGEGIAPNGQVTFRGTARYVYLLEPGSRNPGVPPNFDRPAGTIWRLDVLPSAAAISGGFAYGTTPEGSYQDTPSSVRAPALVPGKRYHFAVLLDVGLPIANCLFEYGAPLVTSDAGTPVTDAGPSDAQSVRPDAGAPGDGGGSAFGRTCTTNPDCTAPADYCAVLPGQTQGYCTATGCTENASVCPSGWGCLNLALFTPGAPSICTRP